MRKTIEEIGNDRAITWKSILPAYYGTGSILDSIEGVLASIASSGKGLPVMRSEFDGSLVAPTKDTWNLFKALLETLNLPGLEWAVSRPWAHLPEVPNVTVATWDYGAFKFSIDKNKSNITVITTDETVRAAFKAWFDKNTTQEVRQGTVFMLVSGQGGLEITELPGIGGEALERGNYTEQVLADYDRLVIELTNKKPSGRLAILEGVPGSGKSFAVRGLLFDCAQKATMVMVSAGLVSELVGPSGIGTIINFRQDYPDRPLVFILEDADEVLAPRNGYNMSGISSLLNMGDGIVGSTLDIRIVATTNATKSELDDAVKRPGRLTVLSEVGKLPVEQANGVFKRLTGNEGPFKEDKTVAEVYQAAYDSGWKAPKTSMPRKVGFGV